MPWVPKLGKLYLRVGVANNSGVNQIGRQEKGGDKFWTAKFCKILNWKCSRSAGQSPKYLQKVESRIIEACVAAKLLNINACE